MARSLTQSKKSSITVYILHRVPPGTDISELLLDYSDSLISYPDSDNDPYFNWKGQPLLENTELQILKTRLMIAATVCEKCRIVFHKKWTIGLAPRKAVAGDLIVIPHGATAPYIIRWAEEAERGVSAGWGTAIWIRRCKVRQWIGKKMLGILLF